MKKKAAPKRDDRSLRTFFLYTFIVFFVIIVSLSIKAIFILRQSRFDGEKINIAINQNNRVVAILGFNSIANSTSLLKIKNSNISVSSVGQSLGIIIDGKIYSKTNLSNESSESILTKALFGQDTVQTDLTIFDIARLFFLSKNVPGKDKQIEEIKQPGKQSDTDKVVASLFRDDTISSENISIEIVNATDEPGLGKRLERCLSNIGANVVAVSTPHVPEAASKIRYFGQQTYTVGKLKKLLQFPAEKINRDAIAKIVIIIGKDMQNTSVF